MSSNSGQELWNELMKKSKAKNPNDRYLRFCEKMFDENENQPLEQKAPKRKPSNIMIINKTKYSKDILAAAAKQQVIKRNMKSTGYDAAAIHYILAGTYGPNMVDAYQKYYETQILAEKKKNSTKKAHKESKGQSKIKSAEKSKESTAFKGPSNKAVKEPSNKAAKEPSNKAAKEPSNKASKEPSNKEAKEPSNKASKEPSNKSWKKTKKRKQLPVNPENLPPQLKRLIYRYHHCDDKDQDEFLKKVIDYFKANYIVDTSVQEDEMDELIYRYIPNY